MKKCQPRLLTPFVDGELAQDARQEMEEHLQGCASCGAMLDEVTQAYLHVRAMGRATIPLESLEPAMALFAERAGLELGGPQLRHTIEVARDPDAVSRSWVVAPPPPMAATSASVATPVDEDEAAGEPEEEAMPGLGEGTLAQAPSEPDAPPDPATDVEAEAPAEPDAPTEDGVMAETEAITDGGLPLAPPMSIEPPVDSAPPLIPRPTTAQAPGIGLAEDPEPGIFHVPEPMAPPPPAADPEQMELTGAATEPVDFQAEAPPQELRPPWLTGTAADDPTLEADGRAAVDDAIEAGALPDADAEAQEPEAVDEAEAVEPPAEAEAAEADDDVEPADLTPPNPIPDPGPATRPEPRLEPPPEPWTTVWRPNKGTEPEVSPLSAEPGLRPAASGGTHFELRDLEAPPAEPAEEPATEPGEDLPPGAPGLETHGAGWSDAEQPLPEVEEAMARLRGDLREGVAEPQPGYHEDEPEAYDTMADYRAAVHQRREPRRGVLGLDLGLRSDQVKIGAVAAVILLLVVAATTVALTSNRQATTGAPQAQASTAATPAASAPAATAPTSAASPAATGGVPQLSAPISSGAGGTGYTATKIRGGSPGSGITRIVIELTGSGATPSVQLGRGPDGAAYLVASGINLDPAVVQAFKASGLVTGIGQVGTSGTSLKFTLKGSPQYAMTYLSSPTRLVIDFK